MFNRTKLAFFLLAAANAQEEFSTEVQEEIYAFSPEAKASKSFRGVEISDPETCAEANRVWNETDGRCIRKCKERALYQFIRSKYRCFLRKTAKTGTKYCGARYIKEGEKCVPRTEEVELPPLPDKSSRVKQKRCPLGKYYRKISKS